MTYLKKKLTDQMLDDIRLNLSMQPKKLSADPVCDFCGSYSPKFAYAASRMSNGTNCRCWRWLACLSCSRVIDADDMEVLKVRIAKRLKGMLGKFRVTDAVVMASTELAFKEFEHYAERCNV